MAAIFVVMILVAVVNLATAAHLASRHHARPRYLWQLCLGLTFLALPVSYADGPVGIVGRVLTVLFAVLTIWFAIAFFRLGDPSAA